MAVATLSPSVPSPRSEGSDADYVPRPRGDRPTPCLDAHGLGSSDPALLPVAADWGSQAARRHCEPGPIQAALLPICTFAHGRSQIFQVCSSGIRRWVSAHNMSHRVPGTLKYQPPFANAAPLAGSNIALATRSQVGFADGCLAADSPLSLSQPGPKSSRCSRDVRTS